VLVDELRDSVERRSYEVDEGAVAFCMLVRILAERACWDPTLGRPGVLGEGVQAPPCSKPTSRTSPSGPASATPGRPSTTRPIQVSATAASATDRAEGGTQASSS
jgi:hypothetical protein